MSKECLKARAIAAAENDELASDWRKEPAQYAPVIRELVAELEQAKGSFSGLKKRIDDWKWRALNAEASQARVPLSDEQIAGFDRYVAGTVHGRFARVKALVRMVEAKHGITQEKQG